MNQARHIGQNRVGAGPPRLEAAFGTADSGTLKARSVHLRNRRPTQPLSQSVLVM
jgi:hypothetical protein